MCLGIKYFSDCLCASSSVDTTKVRLYKYLQFNGSQSVVPGQAASASPRIMCQKCKFPGPTSDLLTQALWGLDLKICASRSHSTNAGACQHLRTTVLAHLPYFMHSLIFRTTRQITCNITSNPLIKILIGQLCDNPKL